jgi:hypothetical protein
MCAKAGANVADALRAEAIVGNAGRHVSGKIIPDKGQQLSVAVVLVRDKGQHKLTGDVIKKISIELLLTE